MRLKSIICLAICLVASSLAVHAQVTANFKTYGIGGSPTTLYIKTGGKYIPIKVTPNSMSPTSAAYTYTGDASMVFYKVDNSGAAPAGGGSSSGPNYAPVGKVVYPRSGSFVVYTLVGDDGSVSAMALSATTGDFPLGSYRFINASGYPLTVSLNSKSTDFKPGSAVVLPVSGTAAVMIRFMMAGTQTEVCHVGVDPNSKSRTTCIVVVTNQNAVANGHAQPAFDYSLSGDEATATKATATTGNAAKSNSKQSNKYGN